MSVLLFSYFFQFVCLVSVRQVGNGHQSTFQLAHLLFHWRVSSLSSTEASLLQDRACGTVCWLLCDRWLATNTHLHIHSRPRSYSALWLIFWFFCAVQVLLFTHVKTILADRLGLPRELARSLEHIGRIYTRTHLYSLSHCVLSCWPDGLELSFRFHPGSHEQHRLS